MCANREKSCDMRQDRQTKGRLASTKSVEAVRDVVNDALKMRELDRLEELAESLAESLEECQNGDVPSDAYQVLAAALFAVHEWRREKSCEDTALVNNLRRRIVECDQEMTEIKAIMGLPVETSESSLKSVLMALKQTVECAPVARNVEKDESESARVKELTLMLKKTRCECDKSVQQQTELVYKMKEKLTTEEKRRGELEASIESLKSEIHVRNIENESLRNRLKLSGDVQHYELEIQTKDIVIQELQDMIGKLMAQLDAQADELSDENAQKRRLLRAIQTQRVLLDEAERSITEIQQKLSESKLGEAEMKHRMDNYKKEWKALNDDIREAINDLRECVSEAPEEVSKAVREILQDGMLSSIPLAFLNALKAQHGGPKRTEQSVLDGENDQLFGYLESQNRMLLSLSGENAYGEDMRQNIIQKCADVDVFLRENAPGLLREGTLFDALGCDVHPETLLDHVKTFFGLSDENISPDSREIVVILKEAIAVNAILKNVAESLRKECEIKALEMNKMNNELIDMNASGSEGTVSYTGDELAELKEELNFVRDMYAKLMRAVLRDQECETDQDPFTALVQRDKEHDALSAHVAELSERENRALGAVKSMKGELSDLRELYESLSMSSNDIKTEKGALAAANGRLQAQIAEKEAENRQLSCTIEHRTKAHRDKLRKEKADANTALESQSRTWETKLNDMQMQHQDELRKAQNEAEISRQRIETLKNHFEPLITELRSKISESQAAEHDSREEARRYRTDLSEVKARTAHLAADRKLMDIRVNSLLEKARRDKLQAVDQARAQEMAMDLGIETRVNQVKAEFDREMHTFLAEICDKFRGFVRFDQPITRASVNVLLTDISGIAAAAPECQRLCDTLQTTLEGIRSVLKIAHSANAQSAIDVILSENHRLSESNKQLSCELSDQRDAMVSVRKYASFEQEAKCWSSWGHRIVTITSSGVTSGKSDRELRQHIEESLISNSTRRSCLAWKLDSLRFQKSIQPLLLPSSRRLRGPSRLHLLPVVIIVISLRRIQHRVRGPAPLHIQAFGLMSQ